MQLGSCPHKEVDHPKCVKVKSKLPISYPDFIVTFKLNILSSVDPISYPLYTLTSQQQRKRNMSASSNKSPTQVLMAFYEAERRYMTAGGKAGGASFDEFAGTMSPDVVLHQTPDLPWGGDYHGIERYSDWAAAMSDCFTSVDVQDAKFLESGDQVVVLCTLVTKARRTGETLRHPMVQVITVKDGKISDFRPFYWNVPDYVAAQMGKKIESA